MADDRREGDGRQCGRLGIGDACPCLLDERDASRIARLEKALFPSPWAAEQLRTGLSSGALKVAGVLRGGHLVGYVSWYVVAGEAEIVNLGILPEWRRQGLGRMLLRLMLQSCLEEGIKHAFLEVRVSNAAAIGLYISCGFVDAGRRPRYYPDTGEDALVLRSDIGQDPNTPVKGVIPVMKFIDQLDISGKRLLIRVDYNVPLKDGVIQDDNRIRQSLPTLQLALEKGASLVLCSHLGKAKGKPDPAYSLAPVARHLGKLLGVEVRMAGDVVGPEVEKLAAALAPGEILMLENLRFHPGETTNDDELGKSLAKLGDIYVDDAFGVAHRAHASVVAVTKHAAACCCGLLLKKEWQYLGETLKKPARPYLAISGGAKVSTKLGILLSLMDGVDEMIIGGAMANTFMLAMGRPVGKSLVEEGLVEDARKVMRLAEEKGVKLHLPVDFVLGKGLDDKAAIGVCDADAVPADAMVLDVGPKSAKLFGEAVSRARTIMWNGPMGAFENPAFASGSLKLAEAIAEREEAVTVVGGGDTDAVVHKAGLEDKFSFISTGGGSFLEFLEGKELPAFVALKECAAK